MNIKKIILEEIDEFDWIRDVEPIPEEIKMVPNLPIGKYKFWLGEISEEQQIAILDYLIYVGEKDDSLNIFKSVSMIKDGVISGNYDFNSLYFEVRGNEERKTIITTMMAVYKGNDEEPKEQQLNYCRQWYDVNEYDTIEINVNLNESQLELFGDNNEVEYERCSHFKNNEQHRNLCYELYTLGSFLYRDLGLKNVIDKKIELMGQIEDLNDRYQKPLELLYNTDKFNEITKKDGKYHLEKLTNRPTIYDEKGGWHYVNKLNTNYADLAELLTELFIRGGVAGKLINKNKLGLKKYLNSIKGKLVNVLDKYFSLDEYKEFIRNTKSLSGRGEKAEDEVKEVLEKFGMKTLYEGGHGDFIDMIFGVDLVMGYKGKTYLIQIKNTEDQMIKSSGYSKYKNLDYFAVPTNFGVIIKNKDGRITKLNQEGEVINDPQ